MAIHSFKLLNSVGDMEHLLDIYGVYISGILLPNRYAMTICQYALTMPECMVEQPIQAVSLSCNQYALITLLAAYPKSRITHQNASQSCSPPFLVKISISLLALTHVLLEQLIKNPGSTQKNLAIC